MTKPPALPNLMVAPNGARRGKEDHPDLPITLDETIETALACQRAGADGIHLHVRDKDGQHSLDTGLYREALAALKQAAPHMFLQVTSETAGLYSAEDQRVMIRDLRPASVSVALREMLPAPSEMAAARTFYAWANDAGIAVQHIVYSTDELRWLLSCIDDGTVPGSHHQLQLVLGSYTGTKLPLPTDLDAFLSLLKARGKTLSFDWMVCAFGSAETNCLSYAAARGGKLRVGFENSLWNADGTFAANNAERVAEVRAATNRLAQTLSPADR